MTTHRSDRSPAPPTGLASDAERLPWARRIFVLNLAAEIGIIVTGGLVRLTGSGLGCPTWPQCVPGSYTPTLEQALGIHPYIEFGNRLLTFVVSVLALAVVWAVWRPLAHRRGFRLPTLVLLVGILVQAVVGGISVHMDLNPFVVSVHFLASAVLVAVSAYLVHRLGEGDSSPVAVVHPLVRTVGALAATMLGVVLVLGAFVTGSGPHSGDAAKPERNGLDPRMISWLHADSVMLFVGLSLAVWLACHLDTRARDAARAWGVLLLVSGVQGVVGYTQFFSGLPGALVLIHMLLAGLLAAAGTHAVLTLRRR